MPLAGRAIPLVQTRVCALLVPLTRVSSNDPVSTIDRPSRMLTPLPVTKSSSVRMMVASTSTMRGSGWPAHGEGRAGRLSVSSAVFGTVEPQPLRP